jgi:hypothetical protein
VGPRAALLDALAQVGVDVAKVFHGALQHGLGHTVEQVSNDVVDQPIPLGVIHDVADQMPAWPQSSSSDPTTSRP